ncbi:MAG TPA: hypothetical protein PKC48_02660 [Sphingorhabdus sp.]|uniref:hypothetical protein n=1 Tax=Sphingorhabdus sp. TaxID=1902408 RepID=UPI002C7FEDF4|nr:hypothetical protein [Sphingorhabdus sp.]HMT41501.1 hypothetical protein [Sphingorhabdus sp.]HMU21156.1 hypothetical protein [Sphingorhabdus sp.]
MNWRAGVALSILAFVGGGLVVSWLSTSGLSPWGEVAPSAPEAPVAPMPEIAPPPVNPMLAAPVVPQILQPIADSARTEAMLVAMAARRAIGASAPLGEIEPRLDAAFGQSQPQALARIRSAAKDGLTPVKLATEFDAIAPSLSRDPEMSWARIQRELSTMFVLHMSDAPPPSTDAQIARTRDLILTGNVESAMRLVSAMPGAANAKDWLAKARRYVETQRALDSLEKAALSMPMVAQQPMVAPPLSEPVGKDNPAVTLPIPES